MTKMTAEEVRAAAVKRHYEPKILDNADRGDIAEEIVAGILAPGLEILRRCLARLGFRAPRRYAHPAQAGGGHTDLGAPEKDPAAALRHQAADRLSGERH